MAADSDTPVPEEVKKCDDKEVAAMRLQLLQALKIEPELVPAQGSEGPLPQDEWEEAVLTHVDAEKLKATLAKNGITKKANSKAKMLAQLWNYMLGQ